MHDLLADEISKFTFENLLKHRITMDFSCSRKYVSQGQYFPKDLFALDDRECFVDAGAYHGETILDFIRAVNGRFQFIYAFEPDKESYAVLLNNMHGIDASRKKLCNAALYDEAGEIGFSSFANGASHISETSDDKIQRVTFDEAVGENKPTYIKLDIEGAEAEALRGMKNTIITCRPKIAVSIYHKPEDLWELPLLLHRILPAYRLYIRHYTDSLLETVCYAI